MSYGPSFIPLIYGPRASRLDHINQRKKKRGPVTYSTEQENEVSKICYISEVNPAERKLN